MERPSAYTALMPGESIVIPQALALSPIVEPSCTPDITVTQEIGNEGEFYFQIVDRVSLEKTQMEGFDLLGSVAFVRSVQIADTFEKVHEFDFENVYSISRSWACGSCPHVFISKVDHGDPVYYGPRSGERMAPQRWTSKTSARTVSAKKTIELQFFKLLFFQHV